MSIMNNKVNELQNQIMFANEDAQKARQQMDAFKEENTELKKQLLQFRDAQAKMSEQQAQFQKMQELYQQIQENTDPNAAIIMYKQKVLELQSQIETLNGIIQKLTVEQ